MTRVVEILNEMHEKLEAYMKELPNFKATRENLEKIAKDAQGDFVEVEQESEKWTHIDGDGDRCKVLHTHNEISWVTYYGEHEDNIVPIEELKPIKPTISRSDENALRAFAVWYENETDCESLLDEYLAKHEVIEG
jgi:hypothetical protein